MFCFFYLLANIFVDGAKENTKHLKIFVKAPIRILGKQETEVLLTAQRNSRPLYGEKAVGLVVRHLVITAFVIMKYIYTGCPRRNVPDFGRVFLMLKYTDITQNTYV